MPDSKAYEPHLYKLTEVTAKSAHPTKSSLDPPNSGLHQNSIYFEHKYIPAIYKFDGSTDVLECIEGLETKLKFPNLYLTDHHKVISAMELFSGPLGNEYNSPR